MSLRIGGLTHLSTIDFPGQLSAVIYLQGCMWRCPYCHNKQFQPRIGTPDILFESVQEFLQERIGLLGAVVFSGGEPLLQKDSMMEAMSTLREMGFLIGLHTTGNDPTTLEDVLPMVDWCGLDIKAPIDKYKRVVGQPTSTENFRRPFISLRILKISHVPFEIRTTWDSTLLDYQDAKEMAHQIVAAGGEKWVIQRKTGDDANLFVVRSMAQRAEGSLSISIRG